MKKQTVCMVSVAAVLAGIPARADDGVEAAISEITQPAGQAPAGRGASRPARARPDRTAPRGDAASVAAEDAASDADDTNDTEQTASGKSSIYIGPSAGQNAQESAGQNTIIGASAGITLATNRLNTFVGFRAGSYSRADQNTAVGACAGTKLGLGYGNTLIGHVAGGHITSGSRNVIVGDKAAGLMRSGVENVMLGAGAGAYTHGASRNVFVGKDAGAYGGDGQGNVFLGYQAGLREPGSNKLIVANGSAIGPLITGDFEAGRIGLNGKVGIHTSAPAADLHVVHANDPAAGGLRIENAASPKEHWRVFADQRSGDLMVFSATAGSGAAPAARIDARTGEYRTSSDRRFKQNVQAVGPVLPRVLQLTPRSYHAAGEASEGPRHIGFVADEVEPLFPEAVTREPAGGPAYVSYAGLGAVAIQAIREQQAEIEALRAQNARLQQRLAALEARLPAAAP